MAGQQFGSQVQQIENSVWAKYMGGPPGQKYVWATAHTAHTVPTPMLIHPTVWPQYTNVTDWTHSIERTVTCNGRRLTVAKTATNDARLAPKPKPKQKYGGSHIKELAVPDFLFHFNTIYGPICHRLAAKTVSGFGKTGNRVGEGRLTSYVTLMVERRDGAQTLQKRDKRRQTSAYAQTGNRNMAETA